MTIEVLIPVRNPTEVFFKTVESLAVQTDKNFSVLVSDNFSTTGREHLEKALIRLREAGIAARKIQPPSELGRVEHWNWLHYQSNADWLKPIFAGDALEPEYFAAIAEIVRREPQCRYVYAGYVYHGTDKDMVLAASQDRSFSQAEMQDAVMRFGMQFGPPSAAAYRRDAFFSSGAYDPKLPICADSLLFCKLAARNGAYCLSKPYVHFLIHPARFSNKLPEKERETFRESIGYFLELGSIAWREKWRFPKFGYLRLIARELRRHFIGRRSR